MLLTARMAARSWFDAGAAGNQTTPSTGPGRLGEPIAGWIIRWVVDETRLEGFRDMENAAKT